MRVSQVGGCWVSSGDSWRRWCRQAPKGLFARPGAAHPVWPRLV